MTIPPSANEILAVRFGGINEDAKIFRRTKTLNDVKYRHLDSNKILRPSVWLRWVTFSYDGGRLWKR